MTRLIPSARCCSAASQGQIRREDVFVIPVNSGRQPPEPQAGGVEQDQERQKLEKLLYAPIRLGD